MQVKLVGLSLVTVLLVLAIASSWVAPVSVTPAERQSFAVERPQAIRFEPQGSGYRARRAAYYFEEELGHPLNLAEG